MLSAAKAEVGWMQKLLVAGADSSAVNCNYDSAAIIAAQARNFDVLKFLLVGDAVDRRPSSPSDVRNIEISDRLVKGMSDISEKDMREMISQKADINYKDHNGWTPLTAAVFWRRGDLAEYLLRSTRHESRKQNVKVDKRNGRGKAALHIAARKDSGDIIVLLVHGRADVDARDDVGWTALHHAAFNGAGSATRELIN